MINKNNYFVLNNKNGFTLMELMISVTILSLIAVIIGGSIRLGTRAWEKGEAEIETSQVLRILFERMNQKIKSIYPYQIEKDGKTLVAFQGNFETVWFVTSSVGRVGKNMNWISYSFKNDELTMNEGILPDKELLDKTSEEGELLDSDINSLSFEYFSFKTKEWKDSWELQEQLPSAIRITLNEMEPFVISIPTGQDNEKQ
ncbi:MAG: prepilin-type N-terminal cleavage/methylation domain-containing protein [Proteobacteria bacterium]|nr:prepilin-type N-terminal cleavage/methylation domain-containing protein [Pseudomonadota bacterium]